MNLRKVFIIGGVVAFLWLIVTYSSLIEVPRVAPVTNNVLEMESRIEKLQRQVSEQVADSSKLLETVKKHLKNPGSAVLDGDSEKVVLPGN